MTSSGSVNTPSDPDSQLLLAAVDHSWKWVDSRTSHLFQVANFYLLTTAFLLTAYFAAISARLILAAAGIAAIGFLTASIFGTLGFRGKRFLDVGEVALQELENRLARQIECPELRMMHILNSRRSVVTRPRHFAIALIVALFLWAATFAFSLTL
jgi:hypothetical protein